MRARADDGDKFCVCHFDSLSIVASTLAASSGPRRATSSGPRSRLNCSCWWWPQKQVQVGTIQNVDQLAHAASVPLRVKCR
jgi:hypothetical protein